MSGLSLDSLVAFYFNTNISAAEIIVGSPKEGWTGQDRTVGRPRRYTAQLRHTYRRSPCYLPPCPFSMSLILSNRAAQGPPCTALLPYQLIDRSHRRMTGNIVAKDDYYVLYEYMHACLSLCDS